MRPPAWLLGVLLVLSGCLGGPGAGEKALTASDPASPATSPAGSGEPGESPAPPTSASPNPSTPPRNTTRPPPPAPEPPSEIPQAPWPPIGSASIRPGVQVSSPVGQCTSNFIFKSPENATLYVGLAAHCVGDMKPGGEVTIEGASRPGTLAYSSWFTLGLDACDDSSVGVGAECDPDFALIRIDQADRGKVHPAVSHYGGPITLADSAALEFGDRVLAYGNSGLRGDQESARHQEGLVTDPQGEHTFHVNLLTPSVPGDSGSGVLTRGGGAVGVLVTVGATGQNGVVGLAKALEIASQEGDIDVVLCTWRQLDDGVIP